MSQYLLIERMIVQNANAISGFTWGFPAITNFLGFTHNLNRKIKQEKNLSEVILEGCAVIAHQQHVHKYKDGSTTRFSQNKTAHYLGLTFVGGRLRDPAINEEAKMNMTVSLLIPVKGYLGGIEKELSSFVNKACYTQRLAGGTVLSIENIELVDFTEKAQQRNLRRKLLPGFALQDRSEYLAGNFTDIKENNQKAELLDAWFDFIALKQIARPVCDLIDKHLSDLLLKNEQLAKLNEVWIEHKSTPYVQNGIPQELIIYFSEQKENIDTKTIEQWHNYMNPNNKTNANWEYVKKPKAGYLVPLMVGYKAISDVYPAGTIYGARDAETEVSFVESVHSVGEWQSVHRLKNEQQWIESIWNYTYKNGWYLCKQNTSFNEEVTVFI